VIFSGADSATLDEQWHNPTRVVSDHSVEHRFLQKREDHESRRIARTWEASALRGL
jgi:hypothetical protein